MAPLRHCFGSTFFLSVDPLHVKEMKSIWLLSRKEKTTSTQLTLFTSQNVTWSQLEESRAFFKGSYKNLRSFFQTTLTPLSHIQMVRVSKWKEIQYQTLISQHWTTCTTFHSIARYTCTTFLSSLSMLQVSEVIILKRSGDSVGEVCSQ